MNFRAQKILHVSAEYQVSFKCNYSCGINTTRKYTFSQEYQNGYSSIKRQNNQCKTQKNQITKNLAGDDHIIKCILVVKLHM